jgi:chromate transporter
LFLTFLRLGSTAFGGPAMVAYIRRETVEQQRWLEPRQFDDGVALCQMIPGATAMQAAAYVGLSTRGVAGAAASFIGFGLPAFVLMLALAALYVRTHELPAVEAAFKGLGAIIVAIVANATWSFGERSARDLRRALIAAAAAALFAWGAHPFLVIAMAALAGLLLTTPTQETGVAGGNSFRAALMILGVAAAGFVALFFADRKLFSLAALMFRIDLFAFGGGYASVPLMLHEVVNVHRWLDNATFMNGIVLGQVTPGPIVITATFVGYLVRGLPGAMVATVSVFLPSFLLVVAVTPYFNKLRASPAFNKLIAGALCSFVGLLLNVAIQFATQIDWDVTRVLLAVAAFVALRLKADILWVVLAGTIVSVVLLR